MNERKTEVVNLRMSPGVKEMLRRAAAQEHRTLSNMLEVLIIDYCHQHNILVDSTELDGKRSTDAGDSRASENAH